MTEESNECQQKPILATGLMIQLNSIVPMLTLQSGQIPSKFDFQAKMNFSQVLKKRSNRYT